jgi:DNA polymerase alpha-associated DNA helicase A
MSQALTTLLKTPEEQYTSLQRVLLGLSGPSAANPNTTIPTYFDDTLNPAQREAVRFALASPDLALIHGPPGTGKTYTLIELIRQFLALGQRVLVCGPSNISVDNIVERLGAASPSTPIVRLGHPARLLPGVLRNSLEVLSRTSEQAGIVGDVRREIEEKMAAVRKVKGKEAKRGVWREVRELRREYREREARVTRELVGGSKVVLSTLHGAGGRDAKVQNGGKGYDVLIVDEAAQAVEPQCWVPIVMAGDIRKVVLAGDHMQLPPTIRGADAEVGKDEEKKRQKSLDEELAKLSLENDVIKRSKGWSLEKTMFDRLLGLYGKDIKRLLNVQYRMHERIMRFPSDELYDGELVAAPGVKARLLKDLEYAVEDTDDTREPLVFFDTQGGLFPEKVEDSPENGQVKKSMLLGDSKSNDMEAAVVKMHVQNLIAAGVKDEDIAVVTPYNAQLAALSGMLRETYPGLELGSVDGFQGREKEAVIVSLVRSNPEHEVGFLGEKRRLNVAMTRPKRHLCVIGDSETVSRYG